MRKNNSKIANDLAKNVEISVSQTSVNDYYSKLEKIFKENVETYYCTFIKISKPLVSDDTMNNLITDHKSSFFLIA